jgi:LAO/AO transport system ATPase
MLDELLERLKLKDRLALARLLTMLARGEHVEEILRRLPARPERARIVAITGSGGVGKSSLIGKLLEVFRGPGKTVAVIACDPESPISGGALLGDRFRMNPPTDDGVFIRSLPARGGQSALADRIEPMIELVDSFGFDIVLVETAGAGQGDTRVRALADVVVLLLQPEAGDDLQWEKAGLLEVADVIFVHKADLPGAEHVEAQVRNALALSQGKTAKVLRGSARTGLGVRDLHDAIQASPLRPHAVQALDRALLQTAQEILAARFAAEVTGGQAELVGLLDRWRRGELTANQAAEALLRLLSN